MAQLRELLKEDQEPFLLKSYIEDRRSQLKRPPRTSHSLQLQLKKPKTISHHAPKSSSSLCKSVCFFSHQASPDPRKSPLFDFPSPSPPAKSSNPILLHIPARTAALLLEAALRIQHNSSSFPKRDRSCRKREIGANESRHGSWDSRERVTCISGQCRRASSESVEDKSSHLETTSSSSSHSCEDGANDAEHAAAFGESPSWPSLRSSSSSGDQTPDFASPAPAPSPTRRQYEQDEIDCEAERPKRSGAEVEEEKEQCSPVSVLDPLFNDDEDEEDESHCPEDEGGFDYECSYAIMQRTKQQLLYKLQRFEKLAELDPIELEKRMIELEAEEDDDDDNMEADDSATDQAGSFDATSIRSDGFIGEVIELCFANMRKVPGSLTKLVADLVAEEEGRESKSNGKEAVVKRLCMRMESWKEVDSSTIDMMVENDFRMELDAWKMNKAAIGEMVEEIELAIFSLLVDELSQELA
ncbi:DUF4378 domain-containing protein [Psidium guajava]|nr:DUF4378 domain-containing protein [Psidium guajava]